MSTVLTVSCWVRGKKKKKKTGADATRAISFHPTNTRKYFTCKQLLASLAGAPLAKGIICPNLVLGRSWFCSATTRIPDNVAIIKKPWLMPQTREHTQTVPHPFLKDFFFFLNIMFRTLIINVFFSRAAGNKLALDQESDGMFIQQFIAGGRDAPWSPCDFLPARVLVLDPSARKTRKEFSFRSEHHPVIWQWRFHQTTTTTGVQRTHSTGR